MAKILRDLLDAEEPLFSLALRQLEVASGEHGRDVRLVGEIAEKMRAATTALGLDPDDTTGAELYAAQLARIVRDNKRLAKRVGGTDPDDVDEMLPLMVKAVKKLPISFDCWVIRRSVAKKMLRAMPPRNLMKQLGHRSVDSMLKHEPIDELYVALRFSEGEEWLRGYNKLLAQLTPSDFETRPISFVTMDHGKYVELASSFVKKKRHNVTHMKELGTIVIVPTKEKHIRGLTLMTLPLLLHYINEVRLYSAFFKLKQVSPNFGEIIVETLNADPASASQMAGQFVHWRVIQRYFGKIDAAREHPEVFEPHLQPEDLHWRKAEEMVTMIDPDMKFWHGLDYVGKIIDSKPLTFNLMDVSLSYANAVPYREAYSYHFRESLWNEIFTRYMGAQSLERQILYQLDNDMVAPESLIV